MCGVGDDFNRGPKKIVIEFTYHSDHDSVVKETKTDEWESMLIAHCMGKRRVCVCVCVCVCV